MFRCRRLTSLQQTRLVSQDADRSRRSQCAPIHLILPVQQFTRRTLLGSSLIKHPPLSLCVNSFGHPGCRGLDRNSAFAGDLFPHETYDASTIEEESIGGAIAKEGGIVQRIILKRLVTVAAMVAMVVAIAVPTFAQI